MPELNGEAYLPPGCPALDAVVAHEHKGKLGAIVTPGNFNIDFAHFSSTAAEVRGMNLDASFAIGPPSDRASADVTPDVLPCDPASEQGQDVEWVANLDDAGHNVLERMVGEAYCDRVKKCAGVIIRGELFICGALDPDTLPTIISGVRERLDG